MSKIPFPRPASVSEPLLERLFFHNRVLFLILFAGLTLVLGYQASKIRPDASFEKMIPTGHPYIANFLQHRSELKGLGNAVRIAVATTDESIFTAEFQETLKQIHDEVFFIPGVDRAGLKSIWSPGVRWHEVTEEGFSGGPVVEASYDGSPAELEKLKANVLKSGQVGSLVANNFRSAVIYAPLLEHNPETGEPLSYQRFSEDLEQLVRSKYQSDSVRIHITGFAKVVGELIDGASQVVVFFGMAILITLVLLYLYSHCLRSALVPLACSVIAVFWQLGILHSLGYGLDPYSMLVPFLVFAIGVSHGVQIINTIGLEAARGAGRELAARRAFRALYIPGIIALISDGAGFATLMVIDISVIQQLAIAASIGVMVIIATNLILLPILMSYVGISRRAADKSLKHTAADSGVLWHQVAGFTRRPRSLLALLVAGVLVVLGLYQSQQLKIGDLDAGAPELRPDSVYNQDNRFITNNYSTSSDVLVVMVKTPKDGVVLFDVQDRIDRLEWQLQRLDGVQSTLSLAGISKRIMAGINEGNPKWQALNRNQQLLNSVSMKAPGGFINADSSFTPLLVFLNDHKAETLSRVVAAVESFAATNRSDQVQFLLAAGNAGVEAATNIVIEQAQYQMLIWVYAVVTLLCLLTFRSLRIVLCIILPLALTSLLCQALMAALGIGVKVATLPVIALGVGIGVDYGIYIYSKLQTYLQAGKSLPDAYLATLKTTGRAVAFTGLTLAIGVGTWVFSPIKFQADMGILLTFMFLLNMLGALVLLPALAYLLVPIKQVVTPADQDQLDSQQPKSSRADLNKREELNCGA